LRKGDPTPGQLAQALRDLTTEAVRLSEGYAESIDYAFWPATPGSVARASGNGWRKGETPDPTAQAGRHVEPDTGCRSRNAAMSSVSGQRP
jgi:hypothetical protein